MTPISAIELLQEAVALFGEDDFDWALGDDFAIGDFDDFGVKLEGFGDVVGDGERRSGFQKIMARS